MVALGERECSIQRRHQKIIEESPAPGLSAAMRDRMVEAALKLARAAGYRNAGTAEFLVDGDNFYFLEINARLQVEHPVTELRFGCDLVAEQLRIAAGDRVADPLERRADAPSNAASTPKTPRMIFARPSAASSSSICRRDPACASIRISVVGAEVSPYYDSLIAKLICFGADREQARARMVAALGEFSLLGITNTAAFLRESSRARPSRKPTFRRASSKRHFPHWTNDEADLNHALIAAALVSEGIIGGTRRAGESAAAMAPGNESGGGARSPWAELAGFELWGKR